VHFGTPSSYSSAFSTSEQNPKLKEFYLKNKDKKYDGERERERND